MYNHNKNLKCRFVDSFELNNGNSIVFNNVYFGVNSGDPADYNNISGSGVSFESDTHKMYGLMPGEALGTNNLADISRDDIRFKVTVKNDDGSNLFKGKSGSSYTIKIQPK